MRKCVYTAIFGNYDTPLQPTVKNPDWEHIVFTDNPNRDTGIWRKVIMNTDRPRFQARFTKLFYMATMIGEFDISFWIDANVVIRCDLNKFAEEHTEEFVLLKHPHRNNIIEESSACAKLKKDRISKLSNQLQKYKKAGYKFDNGLVATTIMLRRNTENVRKFCEKWWGELATGSIRDQMSFNYVLWKHPLDMKLISYNILLTDFQHRPHKKWQR